MLRIIWYQVAEIVLKDFVTFVVIDHLKITAQNRDFHYKYEYLKMKNDFSENRRKTTSQKQN